MLFCLEYVCSNNHVINDVDHMPWLSTAAILRLNLALVIPTVQRLLNKEIQYMGKKILINTINKVMMFEHKFNEMVQYICFH